LKRKIFSSLFFIVSSVALVIFIIFFSEFKYLDSTLEKIKFNKQVENVGDTINALLFYQASDYFIFRGTPIGFQYDLLKQMGRDLGKKVNIVVENDPNVAYAAVFSNKYDIVAMDYRRNPIISYYLSYSIPHSYTYPVLIGREKETRDTIFPHILYVPSHFPPNVTVDSLANPKSWDFVYDKNITTEELFDKLQKKEVNYIVCDYNEAITLLPFFSDLKMVNQMGPVYQRQWTLNNQNTKLNNSINQWLASFKKTKKYQNLYKKYLSNKSSVIYNTFKKSRSNKISPYDRIIKHYSEKYGLDWRYVSSIIFQETQFQSNLIGMGGSFGLMQMMPSTGTKYGIDEYSSPEEQISAGVRHLAYMKRIYKDIEDEVEKMKFVSASYNAGPGHINDAQRLCVKYGADPKVWDNVATYLGLKSQKDYYNDPLVKHGYYPGNHTVRYVKQVMDRYNGYTLTVKK